MARLRLLGLVTVFSIAGLTTRARADWPFVPSLRLSSGVASVEHGAAREPGFAGHLDIGIMAPFYASTTGSRAIDAAIGPLIPVLGGRPRSGAVFRFGVGYDRTGPGSRAARNFAASAELGYGSAVCHATFGVAYLTGRLDGARARGFRTNAILGIFYGSAYLDVGVDVWPSVLGDPVDVRVLLGVDLGAFLWMVTEDD